MLRNGPSPGIAPIHRPAFSEGGFSRGVLEIGSAAALSVNTTAYPTETTEAKMTALRYPIGKFHNEVSISEDQKQKLIDDISRVPMNLPAAVSGLSDAQLDTPYRPDGLTAREATHNTPDS